MVLPTKLVTQLANCCATKDFQPWQASICTELVYRQHIDCSSNAPLLNSVTAAMHDHLDKLLCWQHAQSKAAVSEGMHEILHRRVGDIVSPRVQHLAEVVCGVHRQLAGLGAEAGSTLVLAHKNRRCLQSKADIRTLCSQLRNAITAADSG